VPGTHIVLEALLDAFAREIADRIRFFAQDGSEICGFLAPALTAQSEEQSPRFDHFSPPSPARQIPDVDPKSPGSFGDELVSRQSPPFGTRASSGHINIRTRVIRREVAVRSKPDPRRIRLGLNIPAELPAPESNRRMVSLPRRPIGLPEAQQRFVDINQRFPHAFDDLSVTTKDMISWVLHEPTRHRVEMDVENDPIQKPLFLDGLRLVAALPQCTGPFTASIEAPTERTLEVVKSIGDGH
jgi:hypothetical protein